MQEIWFNSWVGKFPWRRNRLPTPAFFGFPGGSAGKESACNVGELGWEDTLEEDKAPTPVFSLRESPWTEESGGLFNFA